MTQGQRPSASDCWRCVDLFLERADLVLDSELVRREDLATLGSTMKLIASVEDGSTSWRRDQAVPPDYYVESAATRVRPFFNNDDPVFHGRVTNALLNLLTDTTPAEVKQVLRSLKKAWAKDEDNYRWSMGVAIAGDPPGQMLTDRQIARDWLYADLVHADADARQRIRHIPREHRLLAATSWVTDIATLTQATKQTYIDLRDAGCLTPRP